MVTSIVCGDKYSFIPGSLVRGAKTVPYVFLSGENNGVTRLPSAALHAEVIFTFIRLMPGRWLKRVVDTSLPMNMTTDILPFRLIGTDP